MTALQATLCPLEYLFVGGVQNDSVAAKLNEATALMAS